MSQGRARQAAPRRAGPPDVPPVGSGPAPAGRVLQPSSQERLGLPCVSLLSRKRLNSNICTVCWTESGRRGAVAVACSLKIKQFTKESTKIFLILYVRFNIPETNTFFIKQ